jgi:integrase
LAKYLDNEQRDFTDPVLFTGNLNTKKCWRIIWYEMIAPGKWKRARPTGDLNRIPELKQRLVAGELLCKMIAEALGKGWRYHRKTQNKVSDQSLNLITALDTHGKGKAAATGSADSARSYLSSVRLFIHYLKQQHLQALTLRELSPVHVQGYVDELIEKKRSFATINNEVGRVGTVFERIKKLYRLPDNPFRLVDRLPETESTYYETLTDKELSSINISLRSKNPQLWLALLLIYYAYLRPKSIVQLRRRHFNFDKKIIIVNPESHKNRKPSVKQILQPLYDALIEMGIDALDQDHFIFSKGLKPGLTAIHRQRLTDAWKQYVIEGMGINKKMYAVKHTGATNFINDNSGEENIKWFMDQMGHSNLSESKAYIDKKKVTRIDESKTKIRRL